MANGHGGARAGAGRKPVASAHAGAITAAVQQIADRLPELIDAQFKLAIGVKMVDTDSDGMTDYYVEAPDFKAAAYLIDRVLGKPTQSVELSGPDGGAVEIEQRHTLEAAKRLDEWRATMLPSSTPSLTPPTS